MRRRASTAADGVYHFETITFGQGGSRVLAARDDIEIALDRHAATGQLQTLDQVRNTGPIGQLKGFTVQLDMHGNTSQQEKGPAF